MIRVFEFFLWFAIYSFFGWVYESILCSTRERRWINRGFLNGPYCPIYGAGALLDLILLGRVRSSALLVLAGMLVTGILEYFTSWLLEKLFHARWWDYSDWHCQIHGRVCLLGGVVFGTMSVLLIKVIHPCVMSITNKIPPAVLVGLAIVLLAGFLVDILFTVIHLNSFNEKLRQAHQKAEQLANELVTRAGNMKNWVEQELHALRSRKIAEQSKTMLQKLTWQERKILRSFPHFQSTRYSELVEKLKEALRGSR